MSPVNEGVSVRVAGTSAFAECEGCGTGAAFDVRRGGESESYGGAANTISLNLTTFDTRHYLDLIRARGATIRRVVRALKPVLGLQNALDAGCGVGFFAQTLTEMGLETRGFDGRFENVLEARKRFPKVAFERGDIESAEIAALGKFDLVLCFGLLYHLESPMRAIRHLRALTGKGLLIESMCAPGEEARMLLREEPRQHDQSLTDLAFYPSESCLVKMLHRAGFADVYRVLRLPEHDDFRETQDRARRRTVLFAAHRFADRDWAAKVGGFERIAEPREGRDPWTKLSAGRGGAAAGFGGLGPGLASRVRRFMEKPRRMRYVALANRMRRVVPSMPVPLRLPFGAWWLAERSALDRELMYHGFETAEAAFVERFLRPGMTVLDVGAHHGLYTLLASRRVGRRGRVIAFEPSPRERRRLRRHLSVNRCGNVDVRGFALGDRPVETDLFLVDGEHDWCNSLRAPNIEERTSTIRVDVRRLDDVLESLGVERVDFIKLDVEGGELSFLHGASRLLGGAMRPAILAEVQDIRTAPWGYAAREIVRFLANVGYGWFALADDGSLESVSSELGSYDGNFVALPNERFEEFQRRGIERPGAKGKTVAQVRGTVRPCREHEFVGG